MEECNPERPKVGHCAACKKLYMARYYQAHKERHAATMRTWRQAHPNYMREYYQARRAAR